MKPNGFNDKVCQLIPKTNICTNEEALKSFSLPCLQPFYLCLQRKEGSHLFYLLHLLSSLLVSGFNLPVL